MESVLHDIQLFITYAHEDEQYRKQLGEHLKLYERRGAITCWHDRLITPGTDWSDKIDEHLSHADLIVALVSASFLASDYCYENELRTALEQHEHGRSRLVPIIIRPVEWSNSPLGALQALPSEAKPVNMWSNEDAAWTDVTKGLMKVTDELREQKQAFLNLIPRILLSYGERRSDLLESDDSEVTRNIARLKLKKATIWKRLVDYRQQAIDYVTTMEEKLGMLYDLTLSRAAIIEFLPTMLLLDLGTKLYSLYVAELGLSNDLEKSDLGPSLFGLPTSMENLKELGACSELDMNLLSGLAEEIRGFKRDVMGPVREIGEKASGEDFEDV